MKSGSIYDSQIVLDDSFKFELSKHFSGRKHKVVDAKNEQKISNNLQHQRIILISTLLVRHQINDHFLQLIDEGAVIVTAD